ncbi:MAG: hypothetical protein SF070_07465 [Gemmatimonadota bacterium]|nr:hypothetical protein [Gemmatimonadota bacterium]
MFHFTTTGTRPGSALHLEAQASRARAWADVPNDFLAALVASTG